MTERLPKREVVTAFLRHRGNIMVVLRSKRVGSYRGSWSGISGYLEDVSPREQVLRELKEETGLLRQDLELLAVGESLEAVDESMGICWIIHPFLFEVEHPERIRLDWENAELRWIAPSELEILPTVPSLQDALQECLRMLDEGGRKGG